MMCRELGVTRSGYYGYMRRNHEKSDDFFHQELLEAVRDIAKASGDSYGSRRMKKALDALYHQTTTQLLTECGLSV